MDNSNLPVWRFESVKLTYLRPILHKGVKSKKTCHASFDFGFFAVMDIGLTRERNDTLSWSMDFGWSHFRLNLLQLDDNPYVEEVMKLARMIKDEVKLKTPVIIAFLDDPDTMPQMITDCSGTELSAKWGDLGW